MPKTSASNGIRPEIRALAVFELNKPVTPKQINDCVGTGDYAAKYVSFLNTRYGFTISSQRDGRQVVSYTMVAEPDNAADLRSAQPKAKVVKMPKAKVKATTKRVKNDPMPVVQKAAAVKIRKPKDEVAETFGNDGSIGSIDPDWDSIDIDGISITKLV